MMILVPLTNIEDSPFQKRAVYDNIEELAADIASHKATRPDTLGLQQVPNGRLVASDDGLMVPTANLIEEDWLDSNGTLRDGWSIQIEFGHRRLRAFRHLLESGHAAYYKMPVFIRDLTDDQMLDGVWSENRQRRDLSAVEEAELLQDKLARLQANGGGSQRDVAEAWGLARPTVANRLSLLLLPEAIQQANREGKLSERQCLALKTVVKVQAAADMETWRNGEYYAPTEPDKFIAETIEQGAAVTSDAIRQYADNALRHAGEGLPRPIANHQFSPLGLGEGLEQLTCKGCPYRINDSCLRPACLDIKKSMYGERAARAAAAEMELPYSDDPAHFQRFVGWQAADDREALTRVHEAGVSDQVVVGYSPGYGSAVRPLHDTEYVHAGDLWQDEGRRLVILGHKTPIDRELLAHAEAVLAESAAGEEVVIEDIPEKYEVEAWEQQLKKTVSTAKRRAKAAVLDALTYEIAGTDALQALLCGKGSDWLDPELFRKKLRDHLWQTGSGVGYTYGYADEIEELSLMLDRAGLGRALLWDSDTQRLEVEAMDALVWWHDRRRWANKENELTKTAERVQAAREALDGHAAALATWGYELDRAAADVQAQLAALEAA